MNHRKPKANENHPKMHLQSLFTCTLRPCAIAEPFTRRIIGFFFRSTLKLSIGLFNYTFHVVVRFQLRSKVLFFDTYTNRHINMLLQCINTAHCARACQHLSGRDIHQQIARQNFLPFLGRFYHSIQITFNDIARSAASLFPRVERLEINDSRETTKKAVENGNNQYDPRSEKRCFSAQCKQPRLCVPIPEFFAYIFPSIFQSLAVVWLLVLLLEQSFVL